MSFALYRPAIARLGLLLPLALGLSTACGSSEEQASEPTCKENTYPDQQLTEACVDGKIVACDETLTCEYCGCPDGRRCDSYDMQCREPCPEVREVPGEYYCIGLHKFACAEDVQPTKSCRICGCPEGLFCNAETSTCSQIADDGTACTDDSQCGEGSACCAGTPDATENTCRPQGRCFYGYGEPCDAGCPNDATCSSGFCTKVCHDDSECGSNSVTGKNRCYLSGGEYWCAPECDEQHTCTPFGDGDGYCDEIMSFTIGLVYVCSP